MVQGVKTTTEGKFSGTILVGFVISDKNGRPLLRYQKNDFQKASASSKNFIYPVPKLVRITGGVADWSIGQSVYRVKEGDVVLLRPADIRHFSRIVSSDPLTCEIIEFVPDFLYNADCIGIFRVPSDETNTVIPAESLPTSEIATLFDSIKEEADHVHHGFADMMRARLMEALIGISRILDVKTESDVIEPWSRSAMPLFPFEYSPESSPLSSEHNLALAYVMDVINAELTGDVSIDSLASEVHMSRSHFCKIFRKYSGMSVTDYITKKRVEHTVKLILESKLSILDAAYASGFTSSSGFYKAFTRVTGTSPKEYLRSIKDSWSK